MARRRELKKSHPSRSSSFWTRQIVGEKREGEAPAELFTHQARQEPRTPDEIASNSKRKAERPPSQRKVQEKLGRRSQNRFFAASIAVGAALILVATLFVNAPPYLTKKLSVQG